jgi:hypothetical protein
LSLTAAPDAVEYHGQPSATVTAHAAPASDDTARWLAGAALVVAAVGVALAVVSRRRA